jgi:hypothetical protein
VILRQKKEYLKEWNASEKSSESEIGKKYYRVLEIERIEAYRVGYRIMKLVTKKEKDKLNWMDGYLNE